MSQETMRDPSVELSLLEWYALPEDEPGELVGGRLEVEEVPNYVHEILVMLLGRLLVDWILPRGGWVAGSDAKFAVRPNCGRKPDLTVFLPGSQLPPATGVIEVPPDVAIEIVSPTPRDGRRDRIEKVDDYARFGIKYYWILDPELRSLEVYELGPRGHYSHVLGEAGGVVETIPGCEGFVLDLGTLWAEIDRFKAEGRESTAEDAE